MNRIVALFVCCLLCLGIVAAEPQKAELKVDVYQWGGDTVLVFRAPWSGSARKQCDTLVLRDGRLTYTLQLTEPIAVEVVPARSVALDGFFRKSAAITTPMLPGSKQRIEGEVKKDGQLYYWAKGSDRCFADAAVLRTWLLPHQLLADSLARRLVRASKNQTEVFGEQLDQCQQKIDSLQLLFLTRFPSSPISGSLLASARYTDQFFDYEKQLSPKVRQGFFKEQIDRWVEQETIYRAIQKAKQEVVGGVEAPPIELPDSSGVVRGLSQLRGKWVVVCFWGSWCGWSVRGVPQAKEVYAKYRSRVEFLGVACNDQPEAWRAAIEAHQLPWINVFQADQGVESAAVRYGIEGYPTQIVVDPAGKIALKVVGQDPGFYTQLARLITEK